MILVTAFTRGFSPRWGHLNQRRRPWLPRSAAGGSVSMAPAAVAYSGVTRMPQQIGRTISLSLWALACCAAAAPTAMAAAGCDGGLVYLDRDGDGSRDPG